MAWYWFISQWPPYPSLLISCNSRTKHSPVYWIFFYLFIILSSLLSKCENEDLFCFAAQAREPELDWINGDGDRMCVTQCLASLMTTNSFASGNIQVPRPSKCKMQKRKEKKKLAALFTAFKINGRGPAVTHRWHFLWEEKKKNLQS